MAAAEEAQSRVQAASLRAAALLATLAIAKTAVVLGLGAAMTMGHYRDDVIVVAIVFFIDVAVGRPAVGWLMYGVLSAWAAINVPVAMATSSPLTLPMLRAARGPIADSIASYATPRYLGAALTVVAFAAIAPVILRRAPRRGVMATAAGAAAAVMIAVAVSGGADTLGLRRNAVTALFAGFRERVPGHPAADVWRTSPVDAPAGSDDLRRLAGIAAGRNVVLIVLESTAAAALRVYGAAEDPTPHLTSLAAGGILFENTYAVYPESIRALFAVLCGRSPAFDVPAEALAEAACDPLPAVLRDAGYRTALFHSGRFAYLGMQELIERVGFDATMDAGGIGGNVRSSFGVDEKSTVGKMIEWLDRAAQIEPFFLAYLPVAGHHPYLSSEPGPFDSSTEAGAYRNALFEGDRAIGMLFDHLRQRGWFDRTLFVVVGDHGEAFGEHPGNIGHSLFIYEENLRVPLIIAAPGATAPRRVSRVASIVDTPATVLDLLRLSPQRGHEGASLLDPSARMALFFTDYAIGWLGLRDGCWKFLHAIEPRQSMLFDVCVDPQERSDVAPLHADRVSRYRERVLAWSAAQRSAFGR